MLRNINGRYNHMLLQLLFMIMWMMMATVVMKTTTTIIVMSSSLSMSWQQLNDVVATVEYKRHRLT